MHSYRRGYSSTCTSLAAGFAGSSGLLLYSRVPVHANSANMLSLRRGFCTFNSASFILVIVSYTRSNTNMEASAHKLVYLAIVSDESQTRAAQCCMSCPNFFVHVTNFYEHV